MRPLILAVIAAVQFFSLPLMAVPGGLSIEMVSEVTEIVPGQPFYVGLFLQHDPGYHTYWKCPGIVGVPTQIDWDLPAGFEASELQFPEPERVHMYSILAQGYERDVLIQAKITPPKDLKPGAEVDVGGKAWWMCCAQECNPDAKDLSVRLPVTAAKSESLDPKWHAVFEKERRVHPIESNAWSATATEVGDEITLSMVPATDEARSIHEGEQGSLIVFTEDGWFDSNKPQIIERLPAGGVRFKLTKAAVYLEDGIPEQLQVIVQNPKGWLKEGYSRSLQVAPKIERK